jgi:hypothetical protein
MTCPIAFSDSSFRIDGYVNRNLLRWLPQIILRVTMVMRLFSEQRFSKENDLLESGIISPDEYSMFFWSSILAVAHLNQPKNLETACIQIKRHMHRSAFSSFEKWVDALPSSPQGWARFRIDIPGQAFPNSEYPNWESYNEAMAESQEDHYRVWHTWRTGKCPQALL